VTWPALLALAIGTYAMKAAGPIALGSRTLPPRAEALFTLLAVTLLSALVAVSTFADDRSLTLDARAGGLLAGAAAIRSGAPFVVVVVVASAAAAALRLAGG
jgi:branched-subunit amino acid transport protein